MDPERSSTSMPDTAGLRVAVLGPGGVGGLLAGLLARGGADVTCLAGRETASLLDEQGVAVRSALFGDFVAAVHAAERLTEPVDVCLVTVKATQLEAAVARLPADVLGDALLVPLLNGVEHMTLLRERYPRAAVIAGAIRVESTRVAPGEIRHDSPFVAVELAPPAELSPRGEGLAAVLRHLGLQVSVTHDEAAALWGKLAFLAPFALLSTHEAAPLGVVRDRRRAELAAVVAEVSAVARAEGVSIDDRGLIDVFDRLPPTMQSSMQRDAAAGRPTELEAIGGAVLRRAARHGIALPVTERLVGELRARQSADVRSAPR
ncbi:ketopantoate reductase family protein [Blastococcus deserti]|uniref:2-dehydropantoate 2-reductase n=1 Tax=Blastococcus deserti TaxID=2259033 RepID=A0ABW4XA05_9ACTN